jgi:protoporphyrinogen oxidase
MHTTLWPRVMPQYTVGHLSTVGEAESFIRTGWEGRLHLGGNSYFGAGVNDTVLRSFVLADAIAGAQQ